MVAVRRFARPSFLVLAYIVASFASRPASANTLPPNPVLGHPADYVIVTPSALATEFQRLARFKTHSGVPALVKTVESIEAEYPSGRDGAERIRMFLQDAHAQWNTHFVLLGGLPPDLPSRTVRTLFFGFIEFETDHYFGSLAGTWDNDGDGVFGEGYFSSDMPGDSVDLSVDVFVGRAPVRTPEQVHAFVDKTILASSEPFAYVPHLALLSADVLFPQVWNSGDPITLDGADVAEDARSIILATPGTQVTRMYENWNDPRWPDAMPISRTALLSALHAGTDFYFAVNFGSASAMAAGNDSVTAADLATLTDAPRPTRAFLGASYGGSFQDGVLASALVVGSTGGAGACVAPSTFSFPTALHQYQTEFVRNFYPPASKTIGEALALAKLPFIPFSQYDGVNRLTEMELNVIGDPGLRLRPVQPAPLIVDHPSAVSVGSTGFDVSVTSAGDAVEGALVSLMFGEEALAIASTDAAGNAHLDLQPDHVGTLDLTVTAPDGRVFEAPIEVQGALAVGTASDGRHRLDAPQPNPAFASVRFSGAAGTGASLAIFDITGRRLRAFAIAPGRFGLSWDLRDENGRSVPAGLYFTRLSSGSEDFVQRLLVTR
jgi:hypothetical protein